MQKEARFRKRCMEHLRTLPNSHWFRVEQTSIRGTPDCLGLIEGRFVAIEFKSSSKAKLTALQQYHLGEVLNAGGIIAVVYPENWEAAYAELRKVASVNDQVETQSH